MGLIASYALMAICAGFFLLALVAAATKERRMAKQSLLAACAMLALIALVPLVALWP